MNNKKIIWTVASIFILAGTLFLYSCKEKSHEGHSTEEPSKEMNKSMGHEGHEMDGKTVYTCPMHPEVKSDEPGQCPECNMNLVPMNDMEGGEHDGHMPGGKEGKMEGAHKDHDMAKMADKSLFHCPMHPTFTSDGPGECGICGMSLVPVELGEQRESNVKGQAVVKIPERRQQLIGVKIGSVDKRPMIQSIRTIGRVAYDPELYRTQEEYLGALAAFGKVRNSSLPEAVERARSLVESSELRLRLLGLSDRQIKDLANRSGPDTSLLISGGGSGKLWLYADVYESELSVVKVGQSLEARTISYPGEVFRGRVKAIDSVINPKTRSARVRAEIENRDGMLKPDMYLNATIKIDQGERLTVPESAVMDTGARRVVFVAEGDGFFEPREVLLGDKSEDYYHVKSGLSEGEKVVTSGNFLIDSESKLKASLSALAGGHQH